jgi:hypothetical protein
MPERVAPQTGDELLGGRELVRIQRLGVCGQTVHPRRAVESKGIPALRSPRLSDTALLEHQMLDAPRAELATDAEPRLTAADDEGIDLCDWHRPDARRSAARRQ